MLVTVTLTLAEVAPPALTVTVAVPLPTAVTVNEPAVEPAATVATAALELVALIPEAPLAVKLAVCPFWVSERVVGLVVMVAGVGGGPPPLLLQAASITAAANDKAYKARVIVGLL
ncbi:MAG: hypothetical protein ACYDGM_13620 [Vulcanimicrobiaceae bacterium]